MSDPQTTIQAMLDELVASGEERGLQVAVYHQGTLVVDAWAGIADPASGAPVTPDTLFTVYSVSKGITATVLHVLAEQGKIGYDDPIAKHWPEFAQNGKGETLVRHALSHLSGIPQMPPGTSFDDVLDWSGMCDRVAALTPLWPAGETLCYHALTYGWIVGGVAERADGRPFTRIFAEDVVKPLGLTGLFFGVPASEFGRVATMEETRALLDEPPGAYPDIAPRGSIGDAQMNRPEIRQACLPAYGLCANARSLAKVYASLIGDGVDGVRLLPPNRVREASSLQIDGIDASSGFANRFGLGYGLGGPDSSMGPRPSAFGHGGYGGAHGYADPEYGLAVGLAKNRLVVGDVGVGATWHVLHAIRAALGVPD
ncbi:MAG TPA: serine hydrolase domain-containing protein [Thermomicrobiales bacterium]|jgi:CubicO group peptidase (beta-lactamase class C family)